MSKEITQMTVKQLYKDLGVAIRQGYGDKYIVIADDNEGNGLHGMFFSLTCDEKDIKEAVECSNGIYDSQVSDIKKLVILG